MRLRAAALSGLCCLAQGCGAPVTKSAPVVEPCAVALDLVIGTVAHFRGRAVVFSDEDEGLMPPSVDTKGWYGPEALQPVAVSPPPAALVDRLNRTRAVSAVASCPAVRAWLDKAGIAHGAKAVDRAVDPRRMTAQGYAETVLGVSVPVVSADGADALVLTHNVSAPLGGGGQANRLRRGANGRWTVVAIRGLWVS